MSATVDYQLNKATGTEITEHLLRCDASFIPPLSERVEIIDYAMKIASKADRFEAWSGDTLVGLVAAYCNDMETRSAHITSVSVLRAWMKKGIAARLLEQCIAYAQASGMHTIRLAVASSNIPAIRLYVKYGFIAGEADTAFTSMYLHLINGE